MDRIMRVLDTAVDDVESILDLRRAHAAVEVQETVAKIIADVAERGDMAVLESGQRFDSPQQKSLVVAEADLEQASVPSLHEEAIQLAVRRVTRFHLAQLGHLCEGWQTSTDRSWLWWREEDGGGKLGQRIRPLLSAGAYVPGGRANYPSSVIMNTIPAVVAGVPRVAVTSPVGIDGTLPASVLVACRECGVREVIQAGGAAAVAALALGTESIARVDKIVGPGNKYVNEAKRQLWGQVGLDGYAGPSEVCVFADEECRADWAAADLLTQVEHAEDNAGFLVCLSFEKLHEVLDEVERQLVEAPRADVMRAALNSNGLAIVARSPLEAAEVINWIAPEHLTLATLDPERLLPSIVNAGAILMGEHSPESAGDFVLGPSHTLPTSGSARFGSPVNVGDFLKVQSLAWMTPDSLAPLLDAVDAFGEMEGFPTHARASRMRSS